MLFKEIAKNIKPQRPLSISIAVAEDIEIMKAVMKLQELNICRFHLIGDRMKIMELALSLNISLNSIKIIDEPDPILAIAKAVELVRIGESQILMKGLVTTAQILKAVLNTEKGLRTDKKLSHVAVFEIQNYSKPIIVTDAAININPKLEDKVEILQNAIFMANHLDIIKPKIAILSAIENITFQLKSTTDAAVLAKMSERGQIRNAIIDGPLALDNAISLNAAKNKGLISNVAGQADIILVPNLEVGNVLYKSLVYFGNAKVGGIVMGANVPIVLTSRADSYETKFNSMLLALLIAQKGLEKQIF